MKAGLGCLVILIGLALLTAPFQGLAQVFGYPAKDGVGVALAFYGVLGVVAFVVHKQKLRDPSSSYARWWRGQREEQARRSAKEAAQKATEEATKQALALAGVVPPSEHFVCPSCGGRVLAQTWAVDRNRDMEAVFGMDQARLSRVGLNANQRIVLPATLQEQVGFSFEEASERLRKAERWGLVDPVKRRPGYVAAVRCSPCRSRLRNAGESVGAAPQGRDPIPARLRFAVLQRDGFRCRYCGRTAASGAQLHLDHIVPYSKGGATDEDNLITACEQCNLGKSDRPVLPA